MEARYDPPEPIFSTTPPIPAASKSSAIFAGSREPPPFTACDAKKTASFSFGVNHCRCRNTSQADFAQARDQASAEFPLSNTAQPGVAPSQSVSPIASVRFPRHIHFPVTIDKVRCHLRVSAGNDNNAVLSTRRHRDHRYTRSAITYFYAADVHSRFLQRDLDLFTKDICTYFADQLHWITKASSLRQPDSPLSLPDE